MKQSSANEIEMKAWVKDYKTLSKKLHSSAVFLHDFVKVDRYFALRLANRKKSLRYRQDNGKNFLTVKNKTIQNALEVNQEAELEIAEEKDLLHFLEVLGAEEYLSKTKTGKAFESSGFLIELCTIENLGEFIEIECLNSSDHSIDEIQQKILQLFCTLGINPDDIESRTYSQLMRDAKL